MACTIELPFTITAQVNESSALVTVAGEIDPATVGTFTTLVHTLVRDGVSQFTIETSALTFVDSTAIQAMQRLLSAGEDIKITLQGASHRLLDLLLATGLDSLITIET